MRINEFAPTLNEAMPMGGLSTIGQKLRAKLPGLGAELAKGKLETGTLANEIIKAYYRYLGTQPKPNQQPTSQNLINFLKQSQYPIQAATRALNSPVAEAGTENTNIPAYNRVLNKNQINAAIIAAASEIINKGVSSNPSAPQDSAPEPVPSNQSQGLGSAFKAGFTNNRMPTSTGTRRNRLDFADKNSINYVLQQLNKFQQSGGKLDPNQKATLQKIISRL